jgi:hypothetical protein
MAGGTLYVDRLRNVTGVNLSIQSPGAAMALVAGALLTVDAVGNVAIESSGGGLTLGGDAVVQPVGIGTGGVRVITIGNINAASLTLQGGGALNIEAQVGAISIGTAAVAQPINIGTAGARAIAIGGAGATSLGLNANGAISIEAQAGTINIGALANDNAINIGTGGVRVISIGNVLATSLALEGGTALNIEAQAGAINIGTVAVGQPINIGTFGARAIAIGGAGATSLGLNANGAISIEAQAGTISIGALANDNAINIGTGGVRIISIGSATATSLNLNSGAALNIESALGTISIGAGAVGQPINIGTAGARIIAIGSADAASLALEGGLGGITLDCNTTIQARQRLTTTDGVTTGTARVVGGRAYVSPVASAPVNNGKALFTTGAYNIPAATLKTDCTIKWRAVVGVTAVADAGAATLLVEAWFGGLAGTLIAESPVMAIGGAVGNGLNGLAIIEGLLTVRNDASAGAGTMTGYMTSRFATVGAAYTADVLDVAGSAAGTYTVAVNNVDVVSFGLSAVTSDVGTTVVLQDIYIEVVG